MTAIVYSGVVIDAGEMRAERERRGLTQDELGALLDEPGKNIGNWERQGHIPPKKRRKVQERLFGDTATGLSSYSDMALLAELARRLDAAEMVRRLEDEESQRVSNTTPQVASPATEHEQLPESPAAAAARGDATGGPRTIRGRGPKRT